MRWALLELCFTGWFRVTAFIGKFRFFCILIQCNFICRLHMQWDITLFQVKLDCSCIGNVVKPHSDNTKRFPDLA